MTTPRYKDRYDKEIKASLVEKHGYKNVMEIPTLDKIVINMGVGEATQNRAFIENAANDLELISGQKPIIIKAKQSNASFKVREGMAIGVKVTLRRQRMFEFLDRFTTITLPRVRDFRGLNAKSFDGQGNFNMGIKEHIVFPEIEYDKVDKIRGMDIAFHTSAKTDQEAKDLLSAFDMPFKD